VFGELAFDVHTSLHEGLWHQGAENAF